MKVTKTRIETTLYDTNGNKISVVRQKTIEVEDTTTSKILLTKQAGIRVRGRVENYQDNLKKANELREGLHKSNGFKSGERIFHSMADLILIVERE